VKPKLALYWAASCGGCEIAVVDVEEHILTIADFFDIVLWPVAMDFKYKDVEAMPDGEITLCLFNGSIRNSENEHMAKLLRAKSKVLVAFGSCAQEGCIPGLANLFTKQQIWDYVYKQSPSTVNESGIFPQPINKMPEGTIEIPTMWDTVKPLNQVVDVDYYVPGCPPQSDQILNVVVAVIDILKNGQPLPPKGTILGAGDKTCCDECGRERKEKKIKKFVRPHEIIPNPKECLMDQGIVCCGPATRSGCGAKCTAVNVPCRGCYGPPPDCLDPGAKMISALSSVIDASEPEEIDSILATLTDPVGTFYRFNLAASILGRGQMEVRKQS
jgi:F420-non-reducing hydrogenase small subunit